MNFFIHVVKRQNAPLTLPHLIESNDATAVAADLNIPVRALWATDGHGLMGTWTRMYTRLH